KLGAKRSQACACVFAARKKKIKKPLSSAATTGAAARTLSFAERHLYRSHLYGSYELAAEGEYLVELSTHLRERNVLDFDVGLTRWRRHPQHAIRMMLGAGGRRHRHEMLMKQRGL